MLPGDCARGSSVKSSMHCAAVIDSILRAAFEGGILLFFCRKAKCHSFYKCLQSVIQSTEAFTKGGKSGLESGRRVCHIIMMISTQWQCLFDF